MRRNSEMTSGAVILALLLQCTLISCFSLSSPHRSFQSSGVCASRAVDGLRGSAKTRPVFGMKMAAGNLDAGNEDEGRKYSLEDELHLRMMIERNRQARENMRDYFPIDVVVNFNRKFKMWRDEESWKEWSEMNKQYQINPYIPENPEEYYSKKGVWLGWRYWFSAD